MTNMKHKSADAKRARRTRLKRAMEPIIKRFGCTQMQAATYVTACLFDNERLKERVQELEQQLRHQEKAKEAP